MSGLRVVRMAKRAQGNFQNHLLVSSVPKARSDSFILLWNLSTNPLASG